MSWPKCQLLKYLPVSALKCCFFGIGVVKSVGNKLFVQFATMLNISMCIFIIFGSTNGNTTLIIFNISRRVSLIFEQHHIYQRIYYTVDNIC